MIHEIQTEKLQQWQQVDEDVDLIDPLADDGREVQTMYSGTAFIVSIEGLEGFFQLPNGYAICKWSEATA